MAEHNPLGNTHGNNSKVWQRLMAHIGEGRWIEETSKFREQEQKALEEADQRKDTADRLEANARRANRRRAMPLNDPRIAEERRKADEAMQNARMFATIHQLQTTPVRIPEDVIRYKIFPYL